MDEDKLLLACLVALTLCAVAMTIIGVLAFLGVIK